MRHISKAKTRYLASVIVMLGLAACAAQKPKMGPADTPTPVSETTQQQPSVPETTKPVEKPRVALVLGGAGVASFATVGILKRFHEEGIVIEFIVVTGWPTLFTLGYGFLSSVHDLEWFAMRLQEKDFYKVGLFDGQKDYATHDKLSALIENTFKRRDLGETKIPVVISAANTDHGDPEIYDRGEWLEPLLKTMSVPGIYRPYPKGQESEWIQSLQGLDVDEAIRRGAKTVVAVQMYNDYFNQVGTTKKDSSERVFRQLYLAQIKRSLKKEMKLAQITGEIHLGKSPTNFTAKRAAIQAGYREGARLVKQLKNP